MISYPDIEKLLAARSEEPPVLSLYMEVPLDPPGLRGLPVRAGDLLEMAAEGPCAPYGPDAGRVLAETRHHLWRLLDHQSAGWLGRCVALFVCGPAGLAEAVTLPAGLGDQAIFGHRPHVRPLLLALQRSPAFRAAVVDRRHAWLFAIAPDRVEVVTEPPADGVRSPRYGGWYGLESHRINDRIAEMARRHFHDVAGLVAQDLRDGQEQLVVGGHADTIPHFLAALPADVRDRFAGSFVADTAALTPARVRALADAVIAKQAEKSGQRLVTRIRQQPPGGLAASGLTACLAAVRQHAVAVLAVPARGLVPGAVCRRCGALGATGPGCAHADSALAIPDLIDEIAVRTLHDGGQVEAVPDPPGGIAARLRFPVGRYTGA